MIQEKRLQILLTAAMILLLLLIQAAPTSAIKQGFRTESHMETMTGTSQYFALDKPVNSTEHAFVLVKYFEGQRTSACGTTAANVQVDPNYGEFSCYLYNTTHVSCQRNASTYDIYISYQVIEAYDGEFNAYRGSLPFSGTSLSFSSSIGASVNSADSMAWVNGMQTSATSRDHRPISFTADVEGTGLQSEVMIRRDFGTAEYGSIRWIVVEWNRSRMPDFNLTKGAVFVGDNTFTSRKTAAWSGNKSSSILFHQIRTSGDDGLDQHAVAGNIDSDSQISFWRYDYTGVPDHSSDVQYYVLDFNGSYAGGVKSRQENIVGVASQCVWDVTLPAPVDMSHALVSVSNSMSGDGTAFPRPFFWFYLSSGNTLNIEKRYNGNNQRVAWEVLELPYFPYVIGWNQTALDLGTGIITSGELLGNAGITVETNQTGITVECSGGDCLNIVDDWPDGSAMDDGEIRHINFTCTNDSIGIFSAMFSVSSSEEQREDIINVTCEFTGTTFIVWNQSTLSLGTGSEGYGDISGSADIESTGANDNINVSCTSGSCAHIQANWTDGTGLADGEAKQAGFSCDDNFEGSASAVFSVISTEDLIPSLLTVNCTMDDVDPPGGVISLGEYDKGVDWIAWNWTLPSDPDYDHVEIWLNSTFRENTTGNSENITGLLPGTWYEIEVRSSDDDGNTNMTWVTDSARTKPNFGQQLIMHSPPNSSTSSEFFRLLNLTVSDDEQARLCVDIYGAIDSQPASGDLLYRNCSYNNNTPITFNWTAPVLNPTADSEVLWHFDNRSDLGEDSSLVRDFAVDTAVHDLACTTECPDFTENSGKFAGAFHYDGGSQYWTISDQFFNDLFAVKSLQVWIKPDDLAGIQTIFEEGGTTNGFALRLNSNKIEFATQDNQVMTVISYPYNDLDSWHFITAQFDAGNMTLYVDGLLVNSTTASYASVRAHTDEGGIGYTYTGDAFDAGAGNYYAGMIDEIRILNSALVGDEVMDDFRLSNNSVHYWKAEGNDGYDSTQGDTWQFTVSTGNVSWNSSMLNIGVFDPENGDQTSYSGLISVGPQTDISVACAYGNCSMITSEWADDTGMADRETMPAGFTCMNTSRGVFSAVFNVTSYKDPSPDQINVSCEMLTDINIIWNMTILDLGSGNEREGELTGTAGIISNGINNNATIVCSQGNCSKIKGNITGRFNMSDGENASVMFTCNDSEPGTFSADFGILSDEDPEPSSITVNCLMINPPPPAVSGLYNVSSGYDWIYWSWTNPPVYDFDHVEVWLNSTFLQNETGSSINVTGLVPGTGYGVMLRTVDEAGNMNTSWVTDTSETLYNNPVNITLNSPENSSSDPALSRLLNVHVDDVENSVLCVELFGRESAAPDESDLLYKNCSVANDSDITYDWSSPVLEAGPAVEVLWHFDNRSEYNENDTSVHDFSTDTTIHDRNCTTHCPQFVDGCKFGGCFDYDGASQFWGMNDTYFESAITARTFQAWIKPASLSGAQIIYEEGGGTNAMGIRLNGPLVEFITRNSGTYDSITAPYTDLTDWHLVTAQFNSSHLTLYIDGTLMNSTTVGYSTIAAHNGAGLGYTQHSNPFPTADYFKGKIDEVRFLNTALNDQEVMDSYSLKYGSTYYWDADVRDDYQTWNNGLWEFMIRDNTPPAVFINTSLNNSITSDTTPGVDFNFTDRFSNTANCTLYIDSAPAYTEVSVSNSSQTVLSAGSPLLDANHTAYVNCTDESGNAGVSALINIATDSTPPFVKALSPSNGTVVDINNGVNITANTTDNFAVKDVYAYVEWRTGSAMQEMLDNDGDDIYDTMFLNTASIGIYNVTIIANDTAGNSNNAAMAWFNVTKDMVPPVVYINTSLNNTITPDPTPAVGFRFTDSESPKANCSLFIDSAPSGTALNVNNDTLTAISANTSLADANHSVFVSCTDGSDNTGLSGTIYYAVDTTAPSVTHVQPQAWTGFYLFDSVNITANVSDSISLGSVYAQIEWKAGSSLQGMDDNDGDGIFYTEFLNTADIGNYNVTIIANDTAGHSNNTEKTWFTIASDTDINITAITPINRSGDADGNVDFIFNLSSNYELDNCSLMLNSTAAYVDYDINRSGQNTIHATGIGIGEYSWRIACFDMYGGWNKSREYRLTVLHATEFGGQTVDFSQADMGNINRLVLESPGNGMINFTGSLDLSGGYDLDSYINISLNSISIDTVHLPALNSSARLEFYNLPYSFKPLPTADSSLCSPGLCSAVSYNSMTGAFAMDVVHFTAYSTTSNSRLGIYDDGDTGTGAVMHKDIAFYANYSNKTTGKPISGAGSWCRLMFESSLPAYDMPFDASTGLYSLNHTFDDDESFAYNITCNGNTLGYEEAEASDSISVSRDKGYLKDGNCTIEYVEKGDDFRQGYLQKNEEARIYCQSPLDITGGEVVDLILIPDSGVETRKNIRIPDVITDKYEMLYP